MGKILAAAVLFASCILSGCRSVSSFSFESLYGRVTYPAGSEICFLDSSKRVLPRFKEAFTNAGFKVVDPSEECTFAVTAEVVSWTYDIDGVGLYGDQHDDVDIVVTILDPRTMRIESRASIFVHDDFSIVEKFALSLLDPPAQATDGK